MKHRIAEISALCDRKRPRQGKIGGKEKENVGMMFGEKLLFPRWRSGLSQEQLLNQREKQIKPQ